MGGIGFYVDSQGRNSASQALRANAQPVNLLQDIFFKFCNMGFWMPLAHRAKERLFGHQCRLLQSASYPHPHDQWRTRIRTRFLHPLHNEMFHAFDPHGWRKQDHTTHVFTPKSLWSHHQFHLIPWRNLHMNDGRRIISEILSGQGIEG